MWVLALGVAAVLSAGDALAQNEKPSVSPGSVTLVEGGPSKRVMLSVPTASAAVTVTVGVSSANGNGDLLMSWSGGSIRLNDANVADTTVEVNPGDAVELTLQAFQDSNASDGRARVTFTNGTGTTDLNVREDDQTEVGVIVSERSLSVREGDDSNAAGSEPGRTYSVRLATRPSGDVTVRAAVTKAVNAIVRILAPDGTNTPDDADALRDYATGLNLVFTNDAGATPWDVAQTVRVVARTDTNIVDGSAEITNNVTGGADEYIGEKGRVVMITERDSVRKVMLGISSDSVDEGEEVTITARLVSNDPSDESVSTLPVDVKVSLSQKKGSTAEGKNNDWKVEELMIDSGDTHGSATLEALHDADADDEMLTIAATVTAMEGLFVDPQQEVSLTIMDDDTYTLEADKTQANEGDEVTLTVKVDPAAELEMTKVMIDLYRASGASVKVADGQDADPVDDTIAIIDEGEKSAEFTLTTAKDGDSDDEIIEVQAKVYTTSTKTAVVGSRLRIDVVDGQDYELSLSPSSIGEADGEASVMVKVETNKVISATKDTMLTLAVDAASTATAMDDYSIMPEKMMITIAKGEKMGMTTLMVTPVADGMDESNETIVLTAWKDDKQVGDDATLTIIDGDSTTYTLSGPSDMNVVEGFEYDIEVTASTPVKANTTVMIMAGEGSTATADEDYMIEDIMIMAGETMGKTKLVVKSDNMADGGSDGSMSEKLVLYGMVGNMRTNEVSFYLWDLAVPALPVFAQLLLAALMAIGGYRRYRRR